MRMHASLFEFKLAGRSRNRGRNPEMVAPPGNQTCHNSFRVATRDPTVPSLRKMRCMIPGFQGKHYHPGPGLELANPFSVEDPAREAGGSIEPRVERGFASATLGTHI